MLKKIEIYLLSFILNEAIYLLFFLKTNISNLLLGTIISLIFIFVLSKIKITKVYEIILLILALAMAIITLSQITNFITYNLLKNYSSVWIYLSFLILSIYLAYLGYHTFIKSLELASYFYLFLKIVTFFLIIFYFKISNFNNITNELHVNQNFLIFAIFNTFIFLAIKYLTNYSLNKKIYSFSLVNFLSIKILIIGIMGTTLFQLYEYPYVNILKRIKYLDFIERMEGILSFQYLISFFFLSSFIILLIKTLIQRILKRKPS